jgi:hypothetical protein
MVLGQLVGRQLIWRLLIWRLTHSFRVPSWGGMYVCREVGGAFHFAR